MQYLFFSSFLLTLKFELPHCVLNPIPHNNNNKNKMKTKKNTNNNNNIIEDKNSQNI